jgi:hypothetical protein
MDLIRLVVENMQICKLTAISVDYGSINRYFMLRIKNAPFLRALDPLPRQN